MSNKCRNKVIIELSVSELMNYRIILGGLKSQEKQFNALLRAVEKSNPERKGLTDDEMEALENAMNNPINFSDDFKRFFDSYDELASLFAYSEDDD